MANPKPKVPEVEALPGALPVKVRHRVLYIKREPASKFHPVGSYEQGDAEAERQGGYLFESIRSEHINKARAAAAPIPFFHEQSEEGGIKVED